MARPTSAWASAGRVVRAVAGHRHEVAVGLLLADEGDLVLGLGLGDEVVDAGLPGDGRGRARVVARDHHGPDAHLAELGEPLDEPLLDGVLELDRRRASGRPPAPRAGWRPGRRCARSPASSSAGAAPSRPAVIASTAPLRTRVPSAVRAPLVRVSARNGMSSAMVAARACEAGLVVRSGRQAELGQALAREIDDRPALRGLVPDRGDERGRERLALRHAGRRDDRRGQAVAVGDGAGLVEQDDVHVARGLDRAAAHRQHVEPRDAVHAGDPDGRQEAADGGRDEAHEERR